MPIARRRSLWVLIPLLLGVGLTWWLTHEGGPPPEGDAVDRASDEAVAPDLRRAGQSAPRPPAAAELVGRPEAPRRARRRGPVSVLVLGPGGEALAGVMVYVHRATKEGPSARTNELGRVAFDDLPYDGSAKLRVESPTTDRLYPRRGGDDLHYLPIRGPEVVFVATTGFRLELEIVEAESGRALTHVPTRLLVKKDAPDPVRLGPTAFLAFPPVGQADTIAFKVEAPRDRLAWEPTRFTTNVSPYATELYVRYPVRRALTSVVVVEHADGTPADARLRPVSIAGRKAAADQVTGDAYGRYHVDGIPHLAGELLEVHAVVERSGHRASRTVKAAIPDDARDPLDLLVRLPPMAPVFVFRGGCVSTIGIGGGAGGSMRGRSGRRVTLPAGTVEVQVRRHDGTPAPRVRVELGNQSGTTDARGRAVFTAVPPGWHPITTRQVGLLPMGDLVEVKGSESLFVELKEPAGATLEVVVDDEARRSLPYATLRVTTPSGEPWVDIESGRQRLDPFTDHAGRRTFGHLESGKVKVQASWGTRKREVSVDLLPGGKKRLEIVLPRPAVPAPPEGGSERPQIDFRVGR